MYIYIRYFSQFRAKILSISPAAVAFIVDEFYITLF